MSAQDRGKPGQGSVDFTTLGERWRQFAVSIMAKSTPRQVSLRFAEQIREKYASVGTGGDLIGKKIQPRSHPNGLSDVALEMRTLYLGRLLEHLLRYFGRDGPAINDRRVQAIAPQQASSPDREYLSPRSLGRRRQRPDHEYVAAEPRGRLSSQTESEVNELKTVIERGGYVTLDPRLQDFLAGILNMRIPAVRIYANQASDAVVKRFRADAVTYEDNILFSAGKYDSRDKAGIALLGHELTHAALARMQHQSMPAHEMLYGHEAEERQALNNEKMILQHLSAPQVDRGPQAPSVPTYTSSASGANRSRQTRTSSPKAALSSRDLTLPPETGSNTDTAPHLSNRQLNLIKEEVYRDLMYKMRVEFERGG